MKSTGVILLALATASQISAAVLGTAFIDGDIEMVSAIREASQSAVLRRQNDGCANSSNGPPADLPSIYPKAASTRSCSQPVKVSGVFDGGMRRYDRGAGFRGADNCLNVEPGEKDTIFVLDDGATLKNVIIGENVKDSVYCKGSCTLSNVWFERTCEDSWSLKNPTSCSSCKMTWTGGAVNGFRDKAVQHNGGGTVVISNVDVFFGGSGKLYRSCGGCGYPTRHVQMSNVRVHGFSKGGALAGINADKGDTARFSKIYVPSSFGSKWPICKKWPDETTDADGKSCIYNPSSDIIWTTDSGAVSPAPAVSPAKTTTNKASPSPAKTSPASSGGSGGSCVAKYGQCGGTSYTGATCCQSGSTCKFSNQYYSQCL